MLPPLTRRCKPEFILIWRSDAILIDAPQFRRGIIILMIACGNYSDNSAHMSQIRGEGFRHIPLGFAGR
jgi:hypothetical protein